jgi:hypothetical protein
VAVAVHANTNANANATNTRASNGFGLLTLSSICPILSVLVFGHLRRALTEAGLSETSTSSQGIFASEIAQKWQHTSLFT